MTPVQMQPPWLAERQIWPEPLWEASPKHLPEPVLEVMAFGTPLLEMDIRQQFHQQQPLITGCILDLEVAAVYP